MLSIISKIKLSVTMAGCTALLLGGVAHATLIDRGNGLIYDSDQNITWLANANLASQQGADSNNDGLLGQQEAKSWAESLVMVDSQGAVLEDWRLPIASIIDLNTHMAGELETLFYDLGGTWGLNLFSVNPVDSELALFTNIQSGWYWGLGSPLSHHDDLFSFSEGVSLHDDTVGSDCAQCHVAHGSTLPMMLNRLNFYAWAVRDGDVGMASIPEPATFLLFATGLIGLSRVRKNRLKR